MYRISCALLCGLAATTAQAADERTVCVSGDVRHIVQVKRPYGWELPCEVHFTTPEESRVVWRAEKAVGFCDRKAAELVARRRASQWLCHTEEVIDTPALTDSSLFSDLPPPR
jgi:hypothetical protein